MVESPNLTDEDRVSLVELRRDFHRHPELGFAEKRTAGIVAERLSALGLAPTTGLAETGVTAMLAGAGDGPVLMLRSDMDALPIREETGLPFASENEGVMHACGHNCHMATLLTAAAALARDPASLSGRIKLCFQPAEEGLGGARRMIEAGVLRDPAPTAAVGLHYWSGLETGKIALQAGPVMAAVDDFEITVTGQGGHAALPHQAVDPLICGAAIVAALQTVVSRISDPMEAVVLTVAEFHSGSAFNIIPDEARLGGTARCFDRGIWAGLPERLETIIAGVCRAHGCGYKLNYHRTTTPVVNDPAVTAIVREVATKLVGEENIVDFRLMGGEDMSAFLDEIPGCFFFVGAGSEAKGIGAAHHNPKFDLDEDALPIGVEMMIRVARHFLGSP
jgi:amidohydrolase